MIAKMTGSGNDFVFVDGRLYPVDQWTPERITAICDRRRGVGADGLAVLEPGSRSGAVRFHFFNRDGGRSEMCGNASLCATRLSVRWELAPADMMVLETDIGEVAARCLPGPGERAEIALPDVPAPSASRPVFELGAGEREAYLFRVGVPHVVLFVEDPDAPAIQVDVRGRTLRYHEALAPEGANVNFVGPGRNGAWRMRTYERGVEAETLACGTGAIAVAAALAASGSQVPPTSIATTSGSLLEVLGAPDPSGAFKSPRLVGEGKLVYTAVME